MGEQGAPGLGVWKLADGAQGLRLSAWGTAPGKDSLLAWYFESFTVLPRGATPSPAVHVCQHFISFLSEIETAIFISPLPVLLIDYKHWCICLAVVLITKNLRPGFQLPAYVYLIKFLISGHYLLNLIFQFTFGYFVNEKHSAFMVCTTAIILYNIWHLLN